MKNTQNFSGMKLLVLNYNANYYQRYLFENEHFKSKFKIILQKMVGFKLKNRIHKLKTRKVKFDLKNKTNDLKRVTNSMIDLTNENNQLKSYLSFIKNIKNIIQ